MFDVRLLSVCGGLAVVFALRRRHIAERSGLRTHRKNTNRMHWSGNAPPLSTSIRCNAVAAHPQEHGSSGRESSRKHAALPVHRNQPDSATTEARRGSAVRKKGVRYASGGAGAPCSSDMATQKRPLVAALAATKSRPRSALVSQSARMYSRLNIFAIDRTQPLMRHASSYEQHDEQSALLRSPESRQ